MHSLFSSSASKGQKSEKDLDSIIDRVKNNDPKLIGIKTLFVHSADVVKLFKALKDNKFCSSVAIHGPGVTNACGKKNRSKEIHLNCFVTDSLLFMIDQGQSHI